MKAQFGSLILVVTFFIIGPIAVILSTLRIVILLGLLPALLFGVILVMAWVNDYKAGRRKNND